MVGMQHRIPEDTLVAIDGARLHGENFCQCSEISSLYMNKKKADAMT
jgi:hypothetical protein